MSYISSQAKLHTASKKLGHKCKPVCRYYTNFAGTTVPPLTKEQYQKAMKRILKRWRTCDISKEGKYQLLLKNIFFLSQVNL